MTGTETPPTFVTTHAIARSAGRNRAVVERLLRQGFKPDAFVEIGGQRQPIFFPARIADVLKSIAPRRRSATAVPRCEQSTEPVRTCAQESPVRTCGRIGDTPS